MKPEFARTWQRSPVQQKSTPKKKQVVIKVRRKGLITRGEKFLYSLVSILFIVICFYIVSFSFTLDTLNRDVQSLEQQVNQQEATNENLTSEIKELSKPERITKIAKENGLKIQDTEVKKANSFDE